MGTKPFDNVENQIGFYGIWCGSCPAGNGSAMELLEDMRRLQRKTMWKMGSKDFDFKRAVRFFQERQKK